MGIFCPLENFEINTFIYLVFICQIHLTNTFTKSCPTVSWRNKKKEDTSLCNSRLSPEEGDCSATRACLFPKVIIRSSSLIVIICPGKTMKSHHFVQLFGQAGEPIHLMGHGFEQEAEGWTGGARWCLDNQVSQQQQVQKTRSGAMNY